VKLPELHLTRKDFRLDWFSGTGAGGQYRNKHMNCCRITHLATGLVTTGQTQRDRISNQREAFENLVKLIVAHYAEPEEGRRTTTEVVRNYHAERNEVLDKASRERMEYRECVDNGDIGPMIEARARAIRTSLA
jgi:protein subunit release factor A